MTKIRRNISLKLFEQYTREVDVIDGIEYVKKREPLSDRQIKILYGRDASDMDNQEYIWGFRDAEKAHGIGVDDE